MTTKLLFPTLNSPGLLPSPREFKEITLVCEDDLKIPAHQVRLSSHGFSLNVEKHEHVGCSVDKAQRLKKYERTGREADFSCRGGDTHTLVSLPTV